MSTTPSVYWQDQGMWLDVLLFLLYAFLGVAVGMAIAFVQDLGKDHDPFQKLPAAYAGGFGPYLSYAFGTSIWVRFATERRTLGLPIEDLNSRIFLTLGDHPSLCAVLVSMGFYLAAIALQTFWKRTRRRV